MQPEDLGRLRSVSDPRLHPDGVRVAFVVTGIDLDEDEYVSRIWLWDGQTSRPFTRGPSDSTPRWSPDGTRLAFVRKEEDDDAQPQIAVMRAEGGEASPVTDFPLGAEDLDWAPDGARLAVVGVTWTDDLADLDDEERKRRPRRITRAGWRLDNRGWMHDRRRHVYLVDPTAEPGDETLLTPGDFNDSTPRWHPDGDRIAFLSARHDERDMDGGTQPFVVKLDGDEPGDAAPVADIGQWEDLAYRPDGVLHLGGHPDRWAWPELLGVYRLEEGDVVETTGDVDGEPYAITPTVAQPGPHWTGDGFLLPVASHGCVPVLSVARDGTVQEVLGGARCITGLSVRPDGSAVAFTASDATDPGELHWWEDGDERVLTDLNADFRDDVALVAPQGFTYETDDGVEVEAWAYLPDGDDQVPLLLNVHGGPASQYGEYFFDEFQVYVAAGYGVVAANPRGSTGRGREWVRAVEGVWADDDPPDLRDISAAVDAALGRFERLDAGRVGVMGGSYGGFATARLLARDDRYRSAVVERGLLNWVSFAGTSDIGTFFDRMYVGRQLPDGIQELWRASPVASAHDITTPTLVIHSEADFRTPIEQGEQFFVVLRRHGVDAEFLRFPDEGHEMSRSGKPRHRVERFEAILDWHARHLAKKTV